MGKEIMKEAVKVNNIKRNSRLYSTKLNFTLHIHIHVHEKIKDC